MRLSQRLQNEVVFVENTLGEAVICSKCGATLSTYADKCSAELSEACPGFLAIEKARGDFQRAAGQP